MLLSHAVEVSISFYHVCCFAEFSQYIGCVHAVEVSISFFHVCCFDEYSQYMGCVRKELQGDVSKHHVVVSCQNILLDLVGWAHHV